MSSAEVIDEDNWDDVYGDMQSQDVKMSNTADGESSRDIAQPTGSTMVQQNTSVAAAPDSADTQHPPGQDSHSIMADHRPEDVGQHTNMTSAPPILSSVAASSPPRDAARNATTAPFPAHTETDLNDASQPTHILPTPDLSAVEGSRSNVNEDPEVEFDSDPYESTSDSDSSDDSTDEEYELMDPASLAQMLMKEKDEGDDTNAKAGEDKDFQPRTAHEVMQEPPPRPEITFDGSQTILPLGLITGFVEGTIIISGSHTGAEHTIEVDAPVVSYVNGKGYRAVGVITDTFGRVESPIYAVYLGAHLKNIVEELGLEVGHSMYHIEQLSRKVFTSAVRIMKGTDASNDHDEEVGEHELDFSDDEMERAYKRDRKFKKQNGRDLGTRHEFKKNYEDQQAQSAQQARRPQSGPNTNRTQHQGRSNHPGRQQDDRPYRVHSREQYGRPYIGPHVRVNIDEPVARHAHQLDYDEASYQPLQRPADYGRDVQPQAPQPAQQRGGFAHPIPQHGGWVQPGPLPTVPVMPAPAFGTSMPAPPMTPDEYRRYYLVQQQAQQGFYGQHPQ